MDEDAAHVAALGWEKWAFHAGQAARVGRGRGTRESGTTNAQKMTGFVEGS